MSFPPARFIGESGNPEILKYILTKIFKITNPVNPRILKILVLLLLAFQSCSELPTGVVQNQPPNTFLSLFPDSSISPQRTRIKITWWGDDPDGLITGYRFSFDSTNWIFTTRNDSTFQLTISGNDSTFHFWVAAVDDKGLIDPTPASNRYPVYNSPPSVTFNGGTEIPETTFTVASFSWTGTDPDGDNTIKYYHWALNDTSTWHRISGTTNLLTLRLDSGLVINANNKLYLKAEDIAGAFSPVIKMPDSNKTWFVRPVTGSVLLLNDYYRTTPTDVQQAQRFYDSALSIMAYSKLDIKVSNGANIPKIVNPMFIETLKLFSVVIWFGNRSNVAPDNTNFDLAQQSLPYFIAAGGKIFFSTGFPNSIISQGNIVSFAPVDSVMNFTFNIAGPNETIVSDNAYPVLRVGGVSLDLTRGIHPRPGSHVIYKMPFNPPYDTNKIVVCLKDTDANPHVVFMSVPLNRMDGLQTATSFLRRVINTDFGIR